MASGGAPPIFDNYYFPRGSHTRGQIVLPATIPGGSGRGSVLRGEGRSRTKLTSTVTSGAFITNANYGAGGVLGAGVEELYIFGNHGVQPQPYGDQSEIDLGDVGKHAISLDGRMECGVLRNRINDFRGSAIRLIGTMSPDPYRVAVPCVADNLISMCHTAIYNSATDARVKDNFVTSCRDYGLLDKAGNVQSSGNHFYGMRWGIAFDNVFPSSAGASHSIGDTFSDCFIGFQNWVNDSTVTAGFSQHCTQYNMYLFGATIVSATTVKVQRSSAQTPNIIGVKIDGHGSAFTGGQILLNTYEHPDHTTFAGGTGIYLDAFRVHIDTNITATPAQSGQTGLLISNNEPTENSQITVRLSGFYGAASMYGVDIQQLGEGNTIRIYGDTNQGTFQDAADKRLRIPSGWGSAGNMISINDEALTDGQQYPP